VQLADHAKNFMRRKSTILKIRGGWGEEEDWWNGGRFIFGRLNRAFRL